VATPVMKEATVSRLGEMPTERHVTGDPGDLDTDPVRFRHPDTTPADIDDPGGTGPIPTVPDRTARPRRSRLLVRLLLFCLVLGLVLGAGGVGAFFWAQRGYDKNIERIDDPFGPLIKERPPVAAPGAKNILLLGSDSRISADPGAWIRGAQRTDAIMIAHVPSDRSQLQITSIPRDSWVSIPGHGKNKINAAFSFGGPTLMVKTVEKLTNVRIDHIMIVDFEGFKDITDDLGGVRINVAKSTSDERSSFSAGPQTMDGETALKYVRQRHNLPGGDFDRVRRQQNWIRAVSLKTLERGTLTNPFKLNRVMNSLTSSIAADEGFSIGEMRSLALSMRKVRGNDLTFLTAPVAGTGRSPDGKQSIVKLDGSANRKLWSAMADDTMADWLTAHPKAALGGNVR
jgi:LCP family protein required for cell wall assembly